MSSKASPPTTDHADSWQGLGLQEMLLKAEPTSRGELMQATLEAAMSGHICECSEWGQQRGCVHVTDDERQKETRECRKMLHNT